MIEQSPHESEIPREFLSPWASVVNAASQQSLHPELQLELAPEHVLYGLPVRLIALHNTDDVLFEILDGSGRLAVVHLT